MSDKNLSRRRLFLTGAAIGAAGLIDARRADASSPSYTPQLNLFWQGDPDQLTGSLDGAYSFLNRMMDAYAQGTALRLIQSYSDQQGLLSTAFTYDNALAINAYLLQGGAAVTRAQILGDALLYAQAKDSLNDGRLRQAYFVNSPDSSGAYVQPALAPFYFLGSSTGDMAWAGMALAQIYAATRQSKYLAGALKLGNWIYANTFDTRGSGGYTGGFDGGLNKLPYKSTEHNIDTYAFFSMLARLSGDSSWSPRAQAALTFIQSMWNASGGFFWTGTTNDGVTANTSNIPEDVQDWSFLALMNPAYAQSLDWVTSNLVTIDTPQTINSKLTGNIHILGETFASLSLRALTPSASYDQPPDPNAVWLEGTAHTVAALLAAERFHQARVFVENIQSAQAQLGLNQTVGGAAIPNGQGIVAASSVLNTGFGFSYYPNLHIGATSWYVIAAQFGNPFHLGNHD
jgi:hypothetical protein